jgi:hypothetical protein
MPIPARVLLGAVIALMMAVPATAQTEEFVPDLREERAYLLCAGSNKVQNDSTPVAWDTTAPATSYTAGAGCGFADTGESDEELKPVVGDDPTGELVLAGTYTGNLSSLSVHLHAIDGPWTRSELFGLELITSVDVDGVTIYDSAGPLLLNHVRSDSGATIFGEYTITDIGLLDEADLAEHEVVVRINARYSDDLYGWVWGAAEIDSGVTFNPPKVAGTRVRAAR